MQGFSDFLESQIKTRVEDDDEVRGDGSTLDYSVPRRIIENSVDERACATVLCPLKTVEAEQPSIVGDLTSRALAPRKQKWQTLEAPGRAEVLSSHGSQGGVLSG